MPHALTQGIVFSVRPPKKSWKNIANLSGGEKTLSSLSLVFALHHYKPTPLYVMDEIDAALGAPHYCAIARVSTSVSLSALLPAASQAILDSCYKHICHMLFVEPVVVPPALAAGGLRWSPVCEAREQKWDCAGLTCACDASADFKNVSIVAHYIKERTKDAQFIIISLRNNMFELADRLVRAPVILPASCAQEPPVLALLPSQCHLVEILRGWKCPVEAVRRLVRWRSHLQYFNVGASTVKLNA